MKIALLALLALAPLPPKDGNPSSGMTVKPLTPLDPIREDQYPTDQFMVAIAGPIAQKLYYYYAPHVKFDLSYPYAPLSRIEATQHEGLACYRRIAKYGPEQYRCNIAFHPAQPGGDELVVASYTFGLMPQFESDRLKSLTLSVTAEGDTRTRNLFSGSCSRLSRGELAGSNIPCAYTVDYDVVTDVYFPDDIYTQGVAVGWGIVPETID